MTHLVVVGSGVAGLTVALEADEAGHDVTLLTKSALAESNTRYAQGGVAVVMTAEDSIASHVEDTLVAGAGLSAPEPVRVLVAEGRAAVEELIERGVAFDRDGDELAHGLEAAHSHARILHAGGDATGAAIASGLIGRLERSRVVVHEHVMVVDVVVEDGRARGVRLLDGSTVPGDLVVLATGGAGQLFPFTTNPDVATADGVAMGLRAGAVAADLEFYQFHPTAFAAPGTFLVSEAVRGEGAVLLDADGHRFMTDVHPDAELAPRDVVARAIAAQMRAQSADRPEGRVQAAGRPVPVRLDATALGADFLAERFPTIDRASRAQGWDWAREPIPVTPAAHYFMGGVRTDVWGRTSVPGLFAVGEVACNGLHGANRLASNSLLEGAVYGTRLLRALTDEVTASGPREEADWAPARGLDLLTSGKQELVRDDLQTVLWDNAGLVRDADGLAAAAQRLAAHAVPEPSDVKSAEDANLLVVARALVAVALNRTESRGGHYRRDHPETDSAQARHSQVLARSESAAPRRGVGQEAV